MADYTNTKLGLGATFPENATESALQECEPLLTPEQLKRRFLFGIPLVSPFPDPVTRKPIVMTDEDLADTILRAVALAESNNFFIFPHKFTEKHPWDKALYDSFAFLRVHKRPVASIERLSIRPANNLDVFVFPLEWIETANLAVGQINVVPINVAAFNSGSVIGNSNTSSSGVFWLGYLTGYRWVPAYWYVDYTAGFPNGQIPKIVNEAIGQQAAILVLQQLQAARALVTSASLGIDGMNQSVAGPGNQSYGPAIELLDKQLQATIKRIKVRFGLSMFSSNV
jgi:hypothetical protein